MISIKNKVRYFYIATIALVVGASLQAMSKAQASAKEQSENVEPNLGCMSSPVSPRVEPDNKEEDKPTRAVNMALALNRLGVCLEKKDAKEADKCYKAALKIIRPLAILELVPSAQYVLGMCHECGKGVKPSMDNAVMYYTMAAKQGERGACQRLADIYENGLGGFEKNEAVASYWKLMS